MTTPAKLAAFAAVLAVALVLSFGLGRTVGPVGQDDPPATHDGPAHERPAHP